MASAVSMVTHACTIASVTHVFKRLRKCKAATATINKRTLKTYKPGKLSQ